MGLDGAPVNCGFRGVKELDAPVAVAGRRGGPVIEGKSLVVRVVEGVLDAECVVSAIDEMRDVEDD